MSAVTLKPVTACEHAETETRLAQTVTRHADEEGRLTDATDLLQFSPAERSKPDECCST